MPNKPDSRVYAGFLVRLAAYLVDSLIVGAALLFVRLPIWISALVNPGNMVVRDIIFEYSFADIFLYLLKVTYFILLTYFTGATIGKRLFHIRVYSTEERKMTLFEVVFRETIGRFLAGLVLNIGYLMTIVHKEKRGLHDLLSDTEVIYCHTKKVYAEPPVPEKQAYEYQPESYVGAIEEVISEPKVVGEESNTDYIPREVKDENP